MKHRIIILAGPTASGKSEFAYAIGKKYPVEIVNADSVQVYKELTIGAAKPPDEWMREVPHHLYGFVELTHNFTAYEYMKVAREKIYEIEKRGEIPLVVGGTGLYIRALLHGLFPQPSMDEELRKDLMKREKYTPGVLYEELQKIDPESAEKLHPSDLVRVTRALEVWYLTGEKMSVLQKAHSFSDSPFEYAGLFLDPPREILRSAITRRTEKMIDAGLIEEVKALLQKGYSKELKPLKSVGYRETIIFLEGEIASIDELMKRIFKATWDLARRQRMWFKKEKGFRFIDPSLERIENGIEGFLKLR